MAEETTRGDLPTAIPNTGSLFSAPTPDEGAPHKVTSADEAQRRVGTRYRVVALAGAGGMGQVVEAIDTVLQRRVAIKFLREARPGQGLDQRSRDAVVREARAMAALRHPGVCRLIEASLDVPAGADGAAWRPFLVMEWVQGLEFSRWCRTVGREDRIGMFARVVSAVASMHSAGLLHLDLKPANIIVDASGEAIVVDFGLAQGRVEAATDRIAGGTPGWSAPEQFTPGAKIEPSADVFALGVLLYELITGRRPFEGASSAELIAQSREGRPPLPESIDPDIDPAIQRICLVALDPDPRRRYSDAALLANDLRRFLDGKPVLARPRQLLEEFAEQVDSTVQAIDRWRKQGMATEDEARSLARLLGNLKRPESPWILESRRLSPSQVSLYLGGWFILLSMTVGAWWSERAWQTIAPAMAWLIPLATALVVGIVGVALDRRGEWRIAFGFLLTTCVAIPASVWNVMRVNLWLASTREGVGPQLVHNAELGLSNDQMLLASGTWLIVALGFRVLLPSAAFAFFGCCASLLVWGSLWTRWFLPEEATRMDGGGAAGWMILVAAAMIGAGWIRDARDRLDAHDAAWKARVSDAGAMLAVGLVSLIVAVSMMAWWSPERFWLDLPRMLKDGSRMAEPTVEQRAAAFLISGVGLLALSMVLSWRTTPLRDRCARALRWIVPSFILMPLAWLEYENASPGWMTWLAVLASASLITACASVAQQWRPFLLAGMVYFGEAVVRTFARFDHEWSGLRWPPLVLSAGLAIAGLLLMVSAWRYAGRRFRPSRLLSRSSAPRYSTRDAGLGP